MHCLGHILGILQVIQINVGEAIQQEGRSHSAQYQSRNFDVVRAAFHMQGVTEAEQSPLAGVISRRVRPGPFCCRRDNIDNIAAPLLAHQRQCVFRHDERRAQVYGHNAVPVFNAKFINRDGFVNTRIVNQSVQASILFLDSIKKLVNRFFICNIKLISAGLVLLRVQIFNNLVRQIGSNIRNDYFRTGCAEFTTNCFA